MKRYFFNTFNSDFLHCLHHYYRENVKIIKLLILCKIICCNKVIKFERGIKTNTIQSIGLRPAFSTAGRLGGCRGRQCLASEAMRGRPNVFNFIITAYQRLSCNRFRGIVRVFCPIVFYLRPRAVCTCCASFQAETI